MERQPLQGRPVRKEDRVAETHALAAHTYEAPCLVLLS